MGLFDFLTFMAEAKMTIEDFFDAFKQGIDNTQRKIDELSKKIVFFAFFRQLFVISHLIMPLHRSPAGSKNEKT